MGHKAVHFYYSIKTLSAFKHLVLNGFSTKPLMFVFAQFILCSV